MNAYLDRLCGFLCECRYEDLPDAVREAATLVAADTLAVIAAGSAEPEVRSLTRSLTAGAPGAASVLGAGRRSSPEIAAFLNGTSGTFLELDEGNRFARGHPGIHVLPAALATAEAEALPGRELLLALALGYEVSARIGIAAKLRPSVHPHGTWGTVGAAVAVAKLAGADEARMRETIDVVSSLGLANSIQTMLRGGTVRNAFAGFAGQTGLRAWRLVEAGFTGEPDGLASVWGKVLSDSWEPAALTDGLGARWEIARAYFKRHACCRYNHAALDALAKISAEHDFAAEDVRSVTVETYALAAMLDDAAPRNTLAAKFSLPFAIATTIVNRSSGLRAFTREALYDRRTLALAARVAVREAPPLSAMLPDKRPARVTLALRDGRRLEGYTETNRGDAEEPYTGTELSEKFFELAERVWPRAIAESLHDAVMGLPRLRDVNELTRPLDGLAPRS